MEWVYDRTQEDVERAKLLTQKYAAGAITETDKSTREVNAEGFYTGDKITMHLQGIFNLCPVPCFFLGGQMARLDYML